MTRGQTYLCTLKYSVLAPDGKKYKSIYGEYDVVSKDGNFVRIGIIEFNINSIAATIKCNRISIDRNVYKS